MADEFISGTTLRIPARLDLVDGLRESFGGFLRSCRLRTDEIDLWKLVLSEALTNAIVHGSGEDPLKFVETTWTQRGEHIVLEVRDSGHGPRDLDVQEPTLPEDPFECGGRGMFIIHQNVDKYEAFTGPSGFIQLMRRRHPNMVGSNPVDQVLDATLEELSQCYESLSAFYRLGEALLKYDSIARFVLHVIEDILKVVPADKVTLSLRPALHEQVRDELADVPYYLPTDEVQGLMGEVMAGGHEQSWEEGDFTLSDPLLSGFGCGFVTPISAAGDVMGVLSLVRVKEHPPLNASELNTLRTFAELVGIAVANENNSITRTKEQQALRELEIASDIQHSLLPAPTIREGKDWRVFARRKGAREVAGDYVDVCFDREGNAYLVVVDVMGKGVSSAFLAAMFRTAFSIILNFHSSLPPLMQALNDILHTQVGDATMFTTACVAKVPVDAQRVEVLNAGHCPALFMAEAGGEFVEIEPSGPPLGIFPGVEYTITSLPTPPGSRLVMLTDGLYEWTCKGDIFGWTPLVNFLQRNVSHEPEKLWDALQGLIFAESDSEEAADDQTLLHWERS